jgi:nitrous oxidase accessory protein NosD
MSGVEVRDCTKERQCIIEDCRIFENLSGIGTIDNQNNVLIKNCAVTKNTEFGVGCKHYSDITIIGNQIEKNGTGVVAFENTSVSLRDNVITRNRYWGLHIRYDVKVGQLVSNTITFNETVGT